MAARTASRNLGVVETQRALERDVNGTALLQ